MLDACALAVDGWMGVRFALRYTLGICGMGNIGVGWE
jgi:hypothetical protein